MWKVNIESIIVENFPARWLLFLSQIHSTLSSPSNWIVCVWVCEYFLLDLNNFWEKARAKKKAEKFEILIDSSHSANSSVDWNSIFLDKSWSEKRHQKIVFLSILSHYRRNIIQSLSTLNTSLSLFSWLDRRRHSPAHKYSRVNSCYYF